MNWSSGRSSTFKWLTKITATGASRADRSVKELADSQIDELFSSDLDAPTFGQQLLAALTESLSLSAGWVWAVDSASAVQVAHVAAVEAPVVGLPDEIMQRMIQQASRVDQPVMVWCPGDGVVASQAPALVFLRFHRDSLHVIGLLIDGFHERNENDALMRQIVSAIRGSDLPEQRSEQSRLDKPAEILLSPLSADPFVELPTDSSPTIDPLSRQAMSDFLSAVNEPLNRKKTSAEIANEARRIVGCDRVSVLIRQRGNFRLLAISGQSSVNLRSNETRLLQQLARRVLKTGDRFWFPNDGDVPPQIELPLEDYLSHSANRSMVVVPVFQKTEQAIDRALRQPRSDPRDRQNKVIGGLIYEHFSRQWDRSRVEPLVDFTAQHGGDALRNAIRHESGFFRPLLNLLGSSRVLTAHRVLPKTLLATAAILMTSAFLYFFPADFYVAADGALVPVDVWPVYARIDAEADDVQVAHGDYVEASQPLISMSSKDLELRIAEVQSSLRSSQQRLETLKDTRFDSGDDRQTVQENINSLKAQIVNFQQQLDVLEKMCADLIVRSPASGQIITWDLKRKLLGRPIARGQMMMEIADVEGDWQLDLHLEDRRIGHVVRALEASDTGTLPVSFLLAADTEQRFKGKLTEIAQATEVTADHQQSIRVRVSVETDILDLEQVRTGITAKIYCGRTSIGYLWLHDVREFFARNVLFYFR